MDKKKNLRHQITVIKKWDEPADEGRYTVAEEEVFRQTVSNLKLKELSDVINK